jgi:hypothetical protein
MTATLDALTRELAGRGVAHEEIEATLHRASLMALVGAACAVMSETTLPTPLYRLVYDPRHHNLDFRLLEGNAEVPDPLALDVNLLDLTLAALLKPRMPVLYEGITGIGKTFTIENLLRTILPRDNFRILRLNQNMSNVTQPYVEGRVENGLVTIRLKRDELDRIAALFIDEVNRGDTNQVLQLQDGRIRLSTGEGGDLGLPIPRYRRGGDGEYGWVLDTRHKRPLFVVSAQNPPPTKDPKYSGTRRGDAAQNNRYLEIATPNIAASVGASSLLLRDPDGVHAEFLARYRDALCAHLRVGSSLLSPEQLAEDWVRVFAFTTDPWKNECASLRSALEFMDAMVVMTSRDLPGRYRAETRISRDWTRVLEEYGVDFTFRSELAEDAEALLRFGDVVASLEEEIVPRDEGKVKKLADAIALIRKIRAAHRSADPPAAYAALPDLMTVEDMACGFLVMLRDKLGDGSKDPSPLVDTVLKEYIAIAGLLAGRVGYGQDFDYGDPNMSVYTLALGHALHACGGRPGEDAVRAFVSDLGGSVAVLRRADDGSECRKPIIARLVADVATLAGFAHRYAAELGPILGGAAPVEERMARLDSVLREKLRDVGTPDIFRHRLPKML